MWVQVGRGNTTRNIPLHKLAMLHGKDLCSVLPALHHLSGSVYTSKVGTKLSECKAFSLSLSTKISDGILFNCLN